MIIRRVSVIRCSITAFLILFLLSFGSLSAVGESGAGFNAYTEVDASEDSAEDGVGGELATTRARACFDTSRHKVHFVRVDKGVVLEVLDWGGSGEPLIFLTGLGNSAHVFDKFAYHFTDHFRVMGITRRGYGLSSKPKKGYDLATRVADNIKVLDHFKFTKAIFVGHSIAGVELSRLGAEFPDRVTRLVYLDAYDYGPLHDLIKFDPDVGPDGQFTQRDGNSPQHMDAAIGRVLGYRAVTADTCNLYHVCKSGKLGAYKTSGDISKAIISGSGMADFEKITAPALGIFARPQAAPPYVSLLTDDQKERYNASMQKSAVWQADVIERFSSGIKNVQVLELPNAPHYFFLTHEGDIVHLIRTFLLGQ